MKLPIDAIRTDGGTQPRTSINTAIVSEYAEIVMAGLPFKDDPVVFFDGVDYWMADGFHRLHGTRQAGKFDIIVDLRQGTQRDAILYSVGANETHGLRRTPADKRKAVRTLLEDAEWGRWSDREIARTCKVSNTFVGTMRAELTPPAGATVNVDSEKADERVYKDRHGNTSTMNVAGQKAAAKERAQAPKPAAKPTVNDDSEADRESPAEIMEAQERDIVRLTEQVKALTADDTKAELEKALRLAEHAQRQQSEAMVQASEAAKREAWTARQLRRCGKAVGVDDPDKIAPAVEAFVRKHKAVA